MKGDPWEEARYTEISLTVKIQLPVIFKTLQRPQLNPRSESKQNPKKYA